MKIPILNAQAKSCMVNEKIVAAILYSFVCPNDRFVVQVDCSCACFLIDKTTVLAEACA